MTNISFEFPYLQATGEKTDEAGSRALKVQEVAEQNTRSKLHQLPSPHPPLLPPPSHTHTHQKH